MEVALTLRRSSCLIIVSCICHAGLPHQYLGQTFIEALVTNVDFNAKWAPLCSFLRYRRKMKGVCV